MKGWARVFWRAVWAFSIWRAERLNLRAGWWLKLSHYATARERRP